MIDKERIARQFVKLVSIDAPSYREREMADYLTKELEELGFSVEEDDAWKVYGGNCGNLYAHRPGSGSPLLLGMHMSGVASVLEALHHLKEENRPTRELEILLSIGEEKHVKGAKVFDFSKVQAEKSIVLDMSGEIGTAAVQAPSQIAFTVKVHGKASHAGFAPQDGVHAIRIAAAAIAEMAIGRIGDDTTVNVGQIEGGRASNIVPDYCEVSGELRSFSHKKALEELAKVEQIFAKEAEKCGGSIEFIRDICYQAYKTDENESVVKEFQKACTACGIKSSLIATFGGSDQNKMSEHGIPGIVMASAMHQVHSCQEYTEVSEMAQVAGIVSELLQMKE